MSWKTLDEISKKIELLNEMGRNAEQNLAVKHEEIAKLKTDYREAFIDNNEEETKRLEGELKAQAHEEMLITEQVAALADPAVRRRQIMPLVSKARSEIQYEVNRLDDIAGQKLKAVHQAAQVFLDSIQKYGSARRSIISLTRRAGMLAEVAGMPIPVMSKAEQVNVKTDSQKGYLFLDPKDIEKKYRKALKNPHGKL
jgi:hypothetical protein